MYPIRLAFPFQTYTSTCSVALRHAVTGLVLWRLCLTGKLEEHRNRSKAAVQHLNRALNISAPGCASLGSALFEEPRI
ncbi:hypothetical protein AMELA_G00115840 [Ameiurus melas]|uniref:Uncharacterized protein n=1 Tax=Ameiurus melas TaxID=219545 RepID=A0A7J6ARU7_AMEME|nr:hypothetical protein AMELA_G00115840 [Ameiurus melas]